ncbi:Rrf2 family transcriptional regulator [Dechloromonas sp. CZR5]|uniref:RrF2 family transcriptional regulator n=1 Tax=Dechloromonas sp. CZR5 TaxID=2608630 RepID=UPI00123DAD90|nr:Rrf2 family transcriptional regulator [Dechloromonas sp. CZR5]
MHLSTFTDYTLRVLMYLAVAKDRLATISELATAYGVSQNHLMKVVHQLSKSGIVESVRGKGGGIKLAHQPNQIRLGGVIRASEGDAPIVECFSAERNGCRIAPACRLNHILARAFDSLFEALDTYTLADLTGNDQELAALMRLNVPSGRLPKEANGKAGNPDRSDPTRQADDPAQDN